MVTETTDVNDKRPLGWVFYDGDCTFCRSVVLPLAGTLRRRGFAIAPLQAHWVRERLRIPQSELLAELRVLTRDGRVLSGVEALACVVERIGWALPLRLLTRLPGGRMLLAAGYRWVAAHRHCVGGAWRVSR